MPGDDANASLSWGTGQSGSSPFVMTIPGQGGKPGKAVTIWGRAGGDQEEMAKRLQEMASQARQQAEHAQQEAQRLHDQLMNLNGGAGLQGGLDMNRVLEERMKRMEEMMQKMMEQRNAKPGEKKEEGKS